MRSVTQAAVNLVGKLEAVVDAAQFRHFSPHPTMPPPMPLPHVIVEQALAYAQPQLTWRSISAGLFVY
jgi:hypothetical protein